MSDLDWNDSEDVVIPRVDAVAVYPNEAGNITIRQQDPMGGDDAIISVPRSYLPSLISALQKHIEG